MAFLGLRIFIGLMSESTKLDSITAIVQNSGVRSDVYSEIDTSTVLGQLEYGLIRQGESELYQKAPSILNSAIDYFDLGFVNVSLFPLLLCAVLCTIFIYLLKNWKRSGLLWIAFDYFVVGVIAVLVAIDAKADLDVSSKYALIQLAEKVSNSAEVYFANYILKAGILCLAIAVIAFILCMVYRVRYRIQLKKYKQAQARKAEKAAEKARLAEAAEADSITEASEVAELI